MSAAATRAPLPLHEEATSYWNELTRDCKQQVDAINAVVSASELPESLQVAWRSDGNMIWLVREHYPSTEIKVSLEFEHWGPTVRGSVRGLQEEDFRFYPEEFEFAIGSDPDQGVVAITGEGRSLCTREFASYVTQQFRRSFPGLSLPCGEC